MKSDQTVVLVTGGAKRIGKAIVEDLVAHGFAVAIHCNHSRDEGEELLTDIYAAGGTACVVQADLADSDAVRRLVGDAKDQLGPVQLLVNNASPFRKMASAIWPTTRSGTGILPCMSRRRCCLPMRWPPPCPPARMVWLSISSITAYGSLRPNSCPTRCRNRLSGQQHRRLHRHLRRASA